MKTILITFSIIAVVLVAFIYLLNVMERKARTQKVTINSEVTIGTESVPSRVEEPEIVMIEGIPFSIMKVRDIADKLPEGSWLCSHKDRFLDEKLYFHQGDVRLSMLSLAQSYSDQAGYFIIGEVMVDRIVGAEIDAAMALIIEGNLTADNVLGGGNEIYVSGDIKINGVFIGIYNHGNITQEGKASVSVVFSEESYSYSFDEYVRSIEFDDMFSGDVTEEYIQDAYESLTQYLRPEFVDTKQNDDPFRWLDLVDIGAIESAMKYNYPILQDKFIKAHNIQFLNPPSKPVITEFIVDDWDDWLGLLDKKFSREEIVPFQKLLANYNVDPLYVFSDGSYYIPSLDKTFALDFERENSSFFVIGRLRIKSNYGGKLPFELDFTWSKTELYTRYKDYPVIQQERYGAYYYETITYVIERFQVSFHLDEEKITSILIAKNSDS